MADHPTTAPVFEEPSVVVRGRLNADEWVNLLQICKTRPGQWCRIKWFDSDRGAERAAVRLKQTGRFPESEWEFTSRRVPVADGGGSKIFARFTAPGQERAGAPAPPVARPSSVADRPVGTSQAVPTAAPTVSDNQVLPDPTETDL